MVTNISKIIQVKIASEIIKPPCDLIKLDVAPTLVLRLNQKIKIINTKFIKITKRLNANKFLTWK